MDGRNLDLAPPDWATLRGLLDALLELPPVEREPWIAQLAPPLDGFRDRLRVLASSANVEFADAVLSRLPVVETSQFASAPPRAESAIPDSALQVGPYRLLREIGAGGMASVWLAERTDMLQGRQVALKLPRLLGARTELSARLAREREILATLQHPHIARLYDAGVADDGQPYLALEYVCGERLDTYCTRNALDVPARLRLFLQVARAVAYAHAQLVVHRDLKPSNILVTEAGEVRLLDFGIAKLLEDAAGAPETELTRLGGRALTPEYAAPEQILGQTIGTAADIYALGVVLFELLTGARPYKLRRDSRAALEDAIVQTDVPRPSTVAPDARLSRQLRGDLDTIVLKALKKAPAERYGTVLGLAEDIERHLARRPVLARPDSRWYRLSRFVARNRTAVGATAAVLVAVLAGAAAALWQAHEARQQRDLAAYQQWRAQTANEFLGFLITDLAADGRPVSMADLLDRGAAMVETRAEAAPPPWAGPVLYELASAYFTLDMPARTAELLLRAEAASRAREDHDLRAAILCTRARMVLRADPATARALVAESQALPVRPSGLSAESLASCGRARALLLELDGDRPAAVQALQTTLTEVHAAAPELRRPRFWLLNELARLHYDHRDLPAALEVNRELLAQMDEAGLGRSLGYLVVGLNTSSTLTALGEIVESHRLQTQLTERLQGLAPEARPRGFVLPQAINLVRLVRYDAALRLVEQDEAALRAAGEPVSPQHALAKARVLILLGRTDEGARLLDAAEADLRKAARRNDRLLEAIALVRVQLTRAQGDLAGAAGEAEALLQRMAVAYGTSPSPNLLHALKLASQVALDRRDAKAAMRYADNAVTIAGRIARRPTASADVGQALLLRAQAHRALGDSALAATDLEAALPALTHGLGADHPDTAEARRLAAAR